MMIWNDFFCFRSTDSQLKLWSLTQKPQCQRTFQGHTNEKNFVGLATDGDYIACGKLDWAQFISFICSAQLSNDHVVIFPSLRNLWGRIFILYWLMKFKNQDIIWTDADIL